MWVRIKLPLRRQSSPGWWPDLLNCVDHLPSPLLTLSVGQPEPTQTSVPHLDSHTHPQNRQHVEKHIWKMGCIFHFLGGLLHVTSKGALGTCKTAIDAATEMPCPQGCGRGRWVAERQPSWEPLGLFRLPIPGVMWHQTAIPTQQGLMATCWLKNTVPEKALTFWAQLCRPGCHSNAGKYILCPVVISRH